MEKKEKLFCLMKKKFKKVTGKIRKENENNCRNMHRCCFYFSFIFLLTKKQKTYIDAGRNKGMA